MAKKRNDISYNEIPDLAADWKFDDRNKLPYSGDSVQNFIKKSFRDIIINSDEKFGHVSYEGGRLIFYNKDGGTQLGAITITGTSYSVNINSNIKSSAFTVLTSNDSYPIIIQPVTKSMEFGSDIQENYPEDYIYKLEIDNGNGYIDKTPENNLIIQGNSTSIDIRKHLNIGTNRVRLIVIGQLSEQPKTITYTVTLTSLYLSCNHTWNKVWFENEDYSINNIFLSGNIEKVLHIKIENNEYIVSYNENTQFDSVPTSFNLNDKLPEKSGIIPIELWMSGEGVETKHIYYNIMYVKSEDINNIKLICINNKKDIAYNFIEDVLLEYATYNINELKTSIIANYNNQNVIIYNSIQNITPQEIYQIKTLLQIDTTDTNNISIDINLESEFVSSINNILIDNTYAYLPTDGYKFYLNPSIQHNSSVDREKIINSAIEIDNNYKKEYNAIWDNFTFWDDAWSIDENGTKALVVKAGSELIIKDIDKPLKPLEPSNIKSLSFEFMFKASNVANYDIPILTCIDTETYNSNSVGLIVFPTKILLLGNNTRLNLFQQLNLSENTIHHITVVIQRGYGDKALNLARIFINGCENVTFSFSGSNIFCNSAGDNQIHIGQISTDSYIYMTRIYEKALEGTQVFSNYLNALIDTLNLDRETLRKKNNILDGNSVNYDLCKKLGYNILTIETDKSLPSLSNNVSYSSGINIHLEYGENPEWNVSIYDAPLDSQGTTSSLYEWHNLTSKIKKEILWKYPNIIDDSTGKPIEKISKTGYFSGYELNPEVQRITWKKNIASQPQGHKMGATRFYNSIFKRVMGGAQQLVNNNILPRVDSRVATYQLPFVGFQKFSNGTRKFIGLYTGGPDKKDKKTFGYDATDKYPNLMMIEGPNHTPFMTRFLVPWTDDVFYDYSNETLSIGTSSLSDGFKQEGWDADIVSDYSSDDENDTKKIYDLYVSEFKPAYDAIYYNSPYIAHIDETGYTLEEINNNLVTFFKNTTRGYSNNLMTFYNDNYELIYYRVKTGKYEILPKNIHNMLEYLGLDGTPSIEEILEKRSGSNWKNKIGEFISIKEACYRQCFAEFIGASDNDAKNSYWRKFLALALGGKWGFNEDDLDTIFQNDNNGQDTKDYYVEPDDTTEGGSDIFQGRTSAFWYALRQYCKDELKNMMRAIINACIEEAEELGIQTNTIHETVFNLIKYYFWDNSSKYFPAIAYNADTQLAYINVWLKDPNKLYNNISPLTQIHGDHHETEKEWVNKRIPYIFSKYQIGAFEAEDADGYGSLEITPKEAFIMEITPAIDLYPRISVGGNETLASYRTKAGEICYLEFPSSSDTGVYLKGLHWLSDIGDLSKFQLNSRGGSDIVSFSIIANRLKRLKVGDETSQVLFNAKTLNVEGASIEEIDARNVTSIEGELNIKKCPRIRKLYLKGTNINTVYPPIGARLNYIEYPETINILFLHNLNLLEENNINLSEESILNIATIYINNCIKINPIKLLHKIYNTENNKLKNIGLTWTGVIKGTNIDELLMLEDITKNIGINGFQGVLYDEDIKYLDKPNISGIIDYTNLYVYQETIDNIMSVFDGLKILYDTNKIYIKFENDAVREICATNWGDGTGITIEQAAAVTSIGTVFKGNTEITSFDEFKYFTGVAEVATSAFEGCTSLNSITFPANLTTISDLAFKLCSFENENLVLDNVTVINQGAFNNTKLRSIVMPNIVSVNGAYNDGYTTFGFCPNIEYLFFGGKVNNISPYILKSSKKSVIMIVAATMPPTFGGDSFDYGGAPAAIYVPDSSLEKYKTATNWSRYTSRIFPISQLATDNSNIYAEIEQYL